MSAFSGHVAPRRELLWDRATIRQRSAELRSNVTRILDTSIVPHGGTIVPIVLLDAPALTGTGDVRSTWYAILPNEESTGLARLELSWSNAALALCFNLGHQSHRDCLRGIQRAAGLLALATDRRQTSAMVITGLADATLARIVAALPRKRV